MNAEKHEPTQAEQLAALVTGNAGIEQMGGAVQRSHRFPLHLFVQIENLAHMADTSVSVIVNQLLECGLEAVREKLPEDVAAQVSRVTKEQIERPAKPLREKAGTLNPAKGSRSKAVK